MPLPPFSDVILNFTAPHYQASFGNDRACKHFFVLRAASVAASTGYTACTSDGGRGVRVIGPGDVLGAVGKIFFPEYVEGR